ncbi:MAG TPA: hypothetical protein VJT67_16170 [Longimicrobiaceae bacterium]|nr:hypothetical protein [Longimicrobiaceae bacterium]
MFKLRSAVLALTLGLTAAGTAAAQAADAGPRRSNTFFVELGGNAILYSLNGEHFFTPKAGLRVGAGYVGVGEDDGAGSADVLLVPVMGTYLLGEGNHHFEVGAGLGYATAHVETTDVDTDIERGSTVCGTATFGYRYQKPTGGVMFRAGFTPMIFSGGSILPWVGLGVGYAF